MSVVRTTDSYTFDQVYDDRLLAAAQRVLDGDDSAHAVSALEGVLLDGYPGDERFDDPLEALALYAPGLGSSPSLPPVAS